MLCLCDLLPSICCVWLMSRLWLLYVSIKTYIYVLNHISAWLKLNPISMVPILIMNFMARVCEIPCWNHIRGSRMMLKLYNLTCWQLTPQHDTGVLSWMSILNLLVNENDFSMPVERHRFLKSHDITLHASFNWRDKCHYEKLEDLIVMITWSGNATIGRKTISGLTRNIICK